MMPAMPATNVNDAVLFTARAQKVMQAFAAALQWPRYSASRRRLPAEEAGDCFHFGIGRRSTMHRPLKPCARGDVTAHS